MSYSAIEGFADGYKGYQANEDKIVAREERDFDIEQKKLNASNKAEDRQFAIEDRESKLKRKDINEKRQDTQYDQSQKTYEQGQTEYNYKLEERGRKDIEKKGMAALANWEASGGKKGMKALIDAYDDPDDDITYTEIRMNPKGGITLLGDEGTDDVAFKDMAHFKSVVTAEISPDKYHETRAATLKTRNEKTKFKEQETIKTNNTIRINKAKAKLEKEVAKSGKVPAKLQITNAILENYKKLYPNVDTNVLWKHAFDRATQTGKTEQQAVAEFAKSITTALSKNAFSEEERAQVSKDVQSMANDFKASYFGKTDEHGMPTDMKQKPVEQAMPDEAPAMTDGDYNGQAMPTEPQQQPKPTVEPKQAAKPINPAHKQKAIEYYGDGDTMLRKLLQKNPNKSARDFMPIVQQVFDKWQPQRLK